MTLITQTLTAPPTAPARNQPPATFIANANADVAWQATNTSELTTLISQVNIVKGEINTAQSDTAADAIATAADAVATAADRVQTGLDRTAAAASAASAAALAGAFVGTSTTSWTPVVGTKLFVTQTGEQYTNNTFLSVVSASTPTALGIGQVISYNAGTGDLTMDIQVAKGTGSHTDWNISLTGTPGPIGPDGWPIATAGGTVDAITANYVPDVTLADTTKVAVVCAGANTSATPTFAPDGLTAHTITMLGGQPLITGSIAGAGFVALLAYNAAATQWELLNPAPVVDGWVKLSEITVPSGSPVAAVDLETTFDSTYDVYEITAVGVQVDTSGSDLRLHFKIGGSYGGGESALFLNSSAVLAGDSNGTIIKGTNYFPSATQKANFTVTAFAPGDTDPAQQAVVIGSQYSGFGTNAINSTVVSAASGGFSGIRITPSSGNVCGKFVLRALKK